MANQYIDAMGQVALNQDPWDTTENSVERFCYVMQDANFNTIGVVTDASGGGRLIERYMYTPYGQRQVYTHGWLMSDLNGDGVVDAADESIVSAGADPAADLDGDGRDRGRGISHSATSRRSPRRSRQSAPMAESVRMWSTSSSPQTRTRLVRSNFVASMSMRLRWAC